MDYSLEGQARSIRRALLAFCKAPDRQTVTASREGLAVRAESNTAGQRPNSSSVKAFDCSVARFQICTGCAVRPNCPVASRRPSGLKPIDWIGVQRRGRVRRSRPVAVSQTFTKRSLLPDASTFPSGLKATQGIPPSCPDRTSFSPEPDGFQMRTEWETFRAVANVLPSALKVTEEPPSPTLGWARAATSWWRDTLHSLTSPACGSGKPGIGYPG